MSNNKKLNIKIARKIFDDEKCTLLEQNYINSKTKMAFTCFCGRDCEKSIQNFRSSPRCKECIKEMKPKNTGKRKKYTYEEVKQYFEDRDCALLSTEYTTKVKKLSYICSCGRPSNITFDKFTQGRRCRECANERVAEKRLYTYTHVLEDFTSKGFHLITTEDEYVDSSQHIYYVCDAEHTVKTTYHDFNSGVRCITCSGSEKHTLSFIRKKFDEAGCELLSTEYFNAKTKMEYICSCGRPSSINYNNFSMGKRCNECRKEKHADSQRLSYEYVKDFLAAHGSTLLSEEYIGVTVPLSYICHCGRDGLSSFTTFKGSKQCKKCSFEATKNPDLTDEDRESQRKIEGYKAWRTAVYKRDGYTCQCCGDNWSGKLNAHHKDGYHWCVERRIDVSNGVTLCEDCHILGESSFHRIYGKINNTEEQYIEWLIEYKEVNKNMKFNKYRKE